MKSEISPPAVTSAILHRQFEAVYRILSDAIADHAFPGCTFGVLVGDQIILQDALGHFTYEADSPPVTANTVYDVASLTKVAATTAAAMLLHQRGLLDLETPLGALLPDFVVGSAPDSQKRLVTLRHLLAHNSGLPGYVEFFRTVATESALFRALLQLQLGASPGERAEYSDPGFMLLGKALEVCAGEDIPSWVKREVFEPMGLAATGFQPPPAVRPSIPPTEEDTHLRNRRIQGEVQDENAWIMNGAAGHAGLFSNAPDLLRFAAEILAAGHETARLPLFDAATVARFAQRQGPEDSSRALGWDTPSEESSAGHCFSPHSIGHLGYSGCSIWIDLDAEVAVVLLTNRTWPDRQSQLIRRVRPAFHDAIRAEL